MGFPAGLRARLARQRFVRIWGGESAAAIFHLMPLVRHFPADRVVHDASPESEWHTVKDGVQAAERAGAPVVWIGGCEPLLHPAIGEVVSALIERGRYVFLHTGGVGLRKRIHEFEPVDRLYLCLEMAIGGAEAPPVSAVPVEGGSVKVVSEAIRVARLSGFHTCVHFTVGATASGAEVAANIGRFQAQHVDGVAVSSGGVLLRPPGNKEIAALVEMRSLVASSGWRLFSRLLEDSYEQSRERAAQSVESDQSTGEANACEETA
jgi:hypothetical protein